MVDFEDDSFDPDHILLPVDEAVSRISTPNVELDSSAYINSIVSMFTTAEVRDSDITQLQQSIASAVNEVLKMISTEVRNNKNAICNDLEKTRDQFISTVTTNLEEKIQRLKNAQNDHAKVVKRYEEAIVLLGEVAA